MISTAMAVYNGGKYLEEQLDSILHQTRVPDEIVIVDDNSTDNSWQILEEYANNHSNIHIYKNESNLGYKKNFLKAMTLCHGDIVFLCDQDDRWHKDKVEKMADILETHNDISVLASSFVFMDSDSKSFTVKARKGLSNNNMYLKPVNPGAMVEVSFEEFCSHNYFQGCALALKRPMINFFIENFTEELPHDWLIAILASYYKGFFFYNVPLFYYRLHSNNAIGVPQGGRNEEWVRLLYAQDCVKAMDVVENVFPSYWNDHPECQARRTFSQEHIRIIQRRDLKGLLKQAGNPYYKELKSFRARLMDIWFILTHKK